VLESLEAKKKERQWLKNQTEGDLDDGKLVEAITGEKNVYGRGPGCGELVEHGEAQAVEAGG